jgi:hypothetical protein
LAISVQKPYLRAMKNAKLAYGNPRFLDAEEGLAMEQNAYEEMTSEDRARHL